MYQTKEREGKDMARIEIPVVFGLFVGSKEEMFYLTTHSTHFIYDYMASDIW